MDKKVDISKFNPGTYVPSCSYDPDRDVCPVDQTGFIDLHDAFVNSSIPGDLSVDSESYNGVEDPASLVGRASDVFDGIRKAKNSVAASAASNAAAAATEGAAATPSGENE